EGWPRGTSWPVAIPRDALATLGLLGMRPKGFGSMEQNELMRVTAPATLLALALCSVLAPRAALAADGYLLLRLDGHYVKWGSPGFGTRVARRCAFVEKPMRPAGAITCSSLVPVEPLLAASAIAPDAFEHEVAAAFALWEEAANVSFTRTDDPGKADILIGAE